MSEDEFQDDADAMRFEAGLQNFGQHILRILDSEDKPIKMPLFINWLAETLANLLAQRYREEDVENLLAQFNCEVIRMEETVRELVKQRRNDAISRALHESVNKAKH